jgi:hypothetical protein
MVWGGRLKVKTRGQMTEVDKCGSRNAERDMAENLNFIISTFRIPTSEFQDLLPYTVKYPQPAACGWRVYL